MGNPRPATSILANEMCTLAKAQDPLASKLIKNDIELNAHIDKYCKKWQVNWNVIVKRGKGARHKMILEPAREYEVTEYENEDTQGPIGQSDIEAESGIQPIVAMDLDVDLTKILLRLRYNLVHGNPEWNATCCLCDQNKQASLTHILKECTFPPLSSPRRSLLEQITREGRLEEEWINISHRSVGELSNGEDENVELCHRLLKVIAEYPSREL